jgi:hypothetical protein
MKDEYKAQSSPPGIRARHGEADDFASGRALAYEWRHLFRKATWVAAAIPAAVTQRQEGVLQVT